MVEDDPDLGIFEEKRLGSRVMLSNPVFVKNSILKSFKVLVSSRATNGSQSLHILQVHFDVSHQNPLNCIRTKSGFEESCFLLLVC